MSEYIVFEKHLLSVYDKRIFIQYDKILLLYKETHGKGNYKNTYCVDSLVLLVTE